MREFASNVLDVGLGVLKLIAVLSVAVPQGTESASTEPEELRYNVLFIISDDLTATALSCYGSDVCKTPNIDSLAARGTRFTRTYCQATYCGPSRASFLSGYYPHAIQVLDYTSPRPKIGDRATWPQHFRAAGYHTARISKIFHMGVPIEIEEGTDGEDDPRSWTQRFNSRGPEWNAPGQGERLEGNPGGSKPVSGGNTFVVVQAHGDDLVHSDGRTAAKAVQLIGELKDRPFFLAVGFVRPHVPFVAPRPYFDAYPPESMTLPEKVPGDWADIPPDGINYKTSANMQMDETQQRKALSGYYASVAYMDAQVGKVLGALDKSGVGDKTIVVFTTDHGFHLGEHDFWAKVSLREESARVPLIIAVPGKPPVVCDSLTELLDLYPTLASLCGLPVPDRLQGEDISPMLDDPTYAVRDVAFSVNKQGFLLRDRDWSFIQYGEEGDGGVELFDMRLDPLQLANLAMVPEHEERVLQMREQLAGKLEQVRRNDLNLPD